MFNEEKKCQDCNEQEKTNKCDDHDCQCNHEGENENHECQCDHEEKNENHECKNEKKKHKKEFVTKDEYDKMQEQYLKALTTAAHHENLSKYYRSEYDKMFKYRSQAVLESILPALDGFQLAFKYDAPTKEAQNYRLGFEFVYKLMISALNNEGMSEIIPTIGMIYDPLIHQVVDTIETPEQAKVGRIAEVLLSGYKFKDRVVRPANVKIYAVKKEELKPEKNSEAKSSEAMN